MWYFYICMLSILSLNVIQASIYTNLKKNVLSMLDGPQANKEDTGSLKPQGSMRLFQHKKQEDAKDKKTAQKKAKVLKHVRTHEENLNVGRDLPSSKFTESIDKRIGKEYFHMDPVLNELRHRRSKDLTRRNKDESDEENTSSDMELKYWLDEWDEHWMQKKFEALNSTQPRGDVVNMVAARPWGVPCGDPNQHDMPWGSCMLPVECDAEYRIYRGDYFCGRTSYICCALQLTNYDMYQGLDISFEGSSFSTDSNEKNVQGGSKEEERKQRIAETKKRKADRDKRKRRIRKSIRRIISEIRQILNRAFRNGTAQRKKKTKELKKFIEMMKKQFRKDRKSVVNVHEFEMVKVDERLQSQLDQIRGVNEAFMSNDTYRELIVNGTVNKVQLARLLRSHPELAKFFSKKRNNEAIKTRRMGGVAAKHMGGVQLKPELQLINEELQPEIGELEPEKEELEPDKELPVLEEENPIVLEYDLEYGMLYY